MTSFKLYRREIRPVIHNCYCAMGVHPTDRIIDEWFPESEENALREKYGNLSDPYDSLIFEERYVYYGDNYILCKAEDYPVERSNR